MTAIYVLTLSCGLWPSNNLESVSHVGRDKQITWIDFKKWEYLNAYHFRYDCAVRVFFVRHAVRVVEGICECSKLIYARFTAICVEVADFVNHLSRCKTTSPTETHSLCLNIEVHESVLILVELVHVGIISAYSQLHLIFHFNESQRCPEGELGNIRNENFCNSHL